MSDHLESNRDQPDALLDEALQQVVARMRTTDRPITKSEDALRQFHARQGSRPTAQPARVTRQMPYLRWQAIVLVGVVLVAGVAMVFRVSSHRMPSTPHRYVTSAGQEAAITLDDNVRVQLAPRSEMVVRGTDIALIGEAEFRVTHRTATPVTVHTGAVTTRVLGTTFIVRHDPVVRSIRVSVMEGRVVLSLPARAQALTIAAGRVAEVADSTVSTTTIGDVTSYTDFTEHKLVFRQVLVAQVLATLGHWYGYEFRLTDSTLAARHLSAAFDSRSVTGTLAALKAVLEVTMTFEGTVVTLHPRPDTTRGELTPRRELNDSFSTQREVGR